MNKTLLLASFLTCASLASFAQAPTLTSANISPALNDSFVSVACDTTGVVQGASGASVVLWDFSMLTPTTLISPNLDTGHVVYAAAAPGYALITAIVSTFTANYAVVTPGTTITNYYNVTASALYNPGFYRDNSNNAIYSPAIQVFQFPFTYLNSFTTPYSGAITYAGITATESGTASVTADGYGNLKLPPVPPSGTPRTFNGVLRVHTFQPFRDSAALFGSIQTDTIETYTWYQPGYHSPLLTINTVRGTALHLKQVSYAQKQIANHESVPGVTLDASLKVYPNPAVNHINILFNTTASEQVRITLVDVLGRDVAVISDEHGPQNISYNVSSLPKGLYLLRLQSATETVTRKIEVQ
jgi:hypothetical protein